MYQPLARRQVWPGAMPRCRRCVYGAMPGAMRCEHPRLHLNGGPGLLLIFERPLEAEDPATGELETVWGGKDLAWCEGFTTTGE